MDAPNTKSTHTDPQLKQRLAGLYEHMARRLGIKQTPRVIFAHSPSNAKKPFGLTAFYNQNDRSVKVYVTERHPTDILRSFAHELIHHWQNEHGALPSSNGRGEQAHYAQKDPVLRKREMEAYLLGNILFRDWQDENRYGTINENLVINNPNDLQKTIKRMLFDIVKRQTLSSYHRERTSGDMQPEDFIEELSRNVELCIERFVDTVNNRGNWENQPNMIKEVKRLIHERIAELCETPQTRNQLYSQWLKAFLRGQSKDQKKNEKYYEIGFFGPDKNHVCWFWNPQEKRLRAAEGGHHMTNFGPEVYKAFRGRYDKVTGELSLTIPEFGKMEITGNLKKNVPPELIQSLNKTFNNPKIFYFPRRV